MPMKEPYHPAEETARTPNPEVERNAVARRLARSASSDFASWNAALTHIIANAEAGHMSPAQRQEKLQQVAAIESQLENCLRAFDAAIAGEDRVLSSHSRAVDVHKAADQIRDWLVKAKVALRAPDILES